MTPFESSLVVLMIVWLLLLLLITMLLLLLLLLSFSRACLQTLRFPGWENRSNILLSWKSDYFLLRAYSFSSMTDQAVIALDDRRTHSNPVTSRLFHALDAILDWLRGTNIVHQSCQYMYVLVVLGRRELVLTRAVKLLLEVEKIFLFFAVLLIYSTLKPWL